MGYRRRAMSFVPSRWLAAFAAGAVVTGLLVGTNISDAAGSAARSLVRSGSSTTNPCPPGTTLDSSDETCTATFNYKGVLQNFTVPDGTSTISLQVYGASGGTGATYDANASGGSETAIVPVTPNKPLSIVVGQFGGSVAADSTAYGGGGPSPLIDDAGGGGSFVFDSSDSLLIAAGGGGGTGGDGVNDSGHGGSGGGPVGQDGGPSQADADQYDLASGGLGGSASSGGAAGLATSESCGTYGANGTGGTGPTTSATSLAEGGTGGAETAAPAGCPNDGTATGGGGGGGGYYAGGGGGSGDEAGGGGGGGSGYVESSATDVTSGTAPTANGEVTIGVCVLTTTSSGSVATAGADSSSSVLGPCGLLVTAEALEGNPPVGLSDPPGAHVEFQEKEQDPAVSPITAEDYTHVFSYTCISGCTNIVVNVKTSGDKNLEGADVTLTLADVSATGGALIEPTGDEGFVCAFSLKLCGSSASDTTDKDGNAYFRYWLPGVVNLGDAPAPVADLLASAKGSTCSCNAASGHSQTLFVSLRPQMYMNRDKSLATADLYGLKALFAKNTSNKAAEKRYADWLIKLLVDSGVVQDKDLQSLIKDAASFAQSEYVDQLLRRTPELVELDWFMAKFGIPADGLEYDTTSVTEWGRIMSTDFLPLLEAKLNNTFKLFKYLQNQVDAALEAASKAILGRSWVEQVNDLVKGLISRGTGGTMTLKLFDVSRCATVKPAGNTCPFPYVQHDGLFMAFSVTPNGAKQFFESPNVIGYNPAEWIKAQCGHHGCALKSDEPPADRAPVVADPAT